jgi:hypothetical protein
MDTMMANVNNILLMFRRPTNIQLGVVDKYPTKTLGNTDLVSDTARASIGTF